MAFVAVIAVKIKHIIISWTSLLGLNKEIGVYIVVMIYQEHSNKLKTLKPLKKLNSLWSDLFFVVIYKLNQYLHLVSFQFL